LAVKNRVITTAVILAVALVGLVILQSTPTDAVNQSALEALEQPTATDQPVDADYGFEGGVMPAIGKMIAALVVVIVAIYVGVYLLRRFMNGQRKRAGQGSLLEVIETSHLAPKRSLALVRVADKAVLIGMGETGMTMLTELDPDQTAVALSPPSEETIGAPQGFGGMVQKAMTSLRGIAAYQRGPAAQEK
jgi:flagellar biosynthetic protein FliO